ncbi:hypothetical protein [Sphingomonas sp.]|jgi:hypothetical protein|uniref:hypothetical protein n=1 Tax=Sphingomonas sp. TaxID=28214 RepID=UPI002E1461A0|nr:hypothetical protein [Sphingomonas sp.]
MDKTMIDLDALTDNGKVHNLSGHDRGVAARVAFELDRHDAETGEVEIVVPEHIYAVSPSFVQGLLSGSFQKFGLDREKFFARYRLVATDLIKRQFDRGISAILTNRDLTTH